MDTAKQALEVLEAAQRRLRELVGSAAAGGEDDLAIRLIDVARSIAGMGRELINGASGQSDPQGPIHPGEGALAQPGVSGEHGGEPEVQGESDGAVTSARRNGAAVPGRPRRSPRKGEYPKFSRRGDWLIKTGWSKKERTEYEHKAPRRVVDLLAAAIAKKGANSRMFTVEDILPLKDSPDGDAPGYQVYVALAWLKSAGLVRVHGRRGYSVRNPTRLSASLASRWASLVGGNGRG